jgi:hypothetical protein
MKKLIIFPVTLLFAILSNAQIVNIPDANFKAALVGNLSINTNGDDEIQVSEASAYTGTINVANLSISNLAGIEAFFSITKLYCQNNPIDSLDISNNTFLSELDCTNLFIEYLNVNNNTALTDITCDHNWIFRTKLTPQNWT